MEKQIQDRNGLSELTKQKSALQISKSNLNKNHSAALKRLNRIQGQLEGISRMIREEKKCLEVLQQTRAAISALKGLELEILREHLRAEIIRAFDRKNFFQANDSIEEVLSIWNKREI